MHIIDLEVAGKKGIRLKQIQILVIDCLLIQEQLSLFFRSI